MNNVMNKMNNITNKMDNIINEPILDLRLKESIEDWSKYKWNYNLYGIPQRYDIYGEQYDGLFFGSNDIINYNINMVNFVTNDITIKIQLKVITNNEGYFQLGNNGNNLHIITKGLEYYYPVKSKKLRTNTWYDIIYRRKENIGNFYTGSENITLYTDEVNGIDENNFNTIINNLTVYTYYVEPYTEPSNLVLKVVGILSISYVLYKLLRRN